MPDLRQAAPRGPAVALPTSKGWPTGPGKVTTVISFNIDQWCAWAPGLESAEDWARWSAAPWAPSADDAAQPDVSFLPAMQRRRLSPLARLAFGVAWPLAEGRAPMPLVFASRHGETPRNYDLLCELAKNEELSPTQFSLSVHNAIIGLWSILRGDTSEMTALSAEADGLEHALQEASLLLGDGAAEVLVIVTEGIQPEPYRPWIHDAPFPYALALRVSRGEQVRLNLGSGDGPAAPWPHALQLVRSLLEAAPTLEHHCGGRQWRWQFA